MASNRSTTIPAWITVFEEAEISGTKFRCNGVKCRQVNRVTINGASDWRRKYRLLIQKYRSNLECTTIMATEKLEFEVEQTEAGPKIELTPEQEAQYERITRNLQEVTSAEVLRKVIAEGNVPRAYWGEFGLSQAIEQD